MGAANRERDAVLARLADMIAAVRLPHVVRVAIDGVDAAGKTTLADEHRPLLEARGRPVVRATIDGFHWPRAERYRRGPTSPEGYYRDSFDYDALRRELLLAVGPAAAPRRGRSGVARGRGHREHRRLVAGASHSIPPLS
jgi:uridine kinase